MNRITREKSSDKEEKIDESRATQSFLSASHLSA